MDIILIALLGLAAIGPAAKDAWNVWRHGPASTCTHNCNGGRRCTCQKVVAQQGEIVQSVCVGCGSPAAR